MMIFTALVIGAALYAGLYFIQTDLFLAVMFFIMAIVIYCNKDAK